jgi:hypothetical protein
MVDFWHTTCIFFILFPLVILGILCTPLSAKENDRLAKSQDFNFVAAGDFGCGNEPSRTIESMAKKDPEIVIALGDLSYDKTSDCWISSIAPLDSQGKIKISIGEHDLTKKMIKYSDYLRHFNMTEPYYSFDYKNVHFLAMDTAKNSIVPYKSGSQQYDFVANDLRKAHDNKNVDWIIVYSFRPFYSSLTEHLGQPILPETYHPLFDKYGVDIVLQAHNHNYQRTFPLRYDGTSFMALFHSSVSIKQDIKYSTPNGTIFLTVGTGGAELHNFTGTVPYVAQQLMSHGFLNVDFKSTKKDLRLSGTFYENTNMNKEDHFVIVKKKVS